jgi:hypothetical protein
LELKGLISTPDSNGCIKPFSPSGIILRRICLAAQVATFEELAALYTEVEVRAFLIHEHFFSSFNTDASAAFLSAGPLWRPSSHCR